MLGALVVDAYATLVPRPDTFIIQQSVTARTLTVAIATIRRVAAWFPDRLRQAPMTVRFNSRSTLRRVDPSTCEMYPRYPYSVGVKKRHIKQPSGYAVWSRDQGRLGTYQACDDD